MIGFVTADGFTTMITKITKTTKTVGYFSRFVPAVNQKPWWSSWS